jgi:hypothetical protein
MVFPLLTTNFRRIEENVFTSWDASGQARVSLTEPWRTIICTPMGLLVM